MRTVITFLLLLISCVSYAQDVWMHPNAGQWDDRIAYKIDLQDGEMYVEKDAFTYFLNDIKKHMHHHDPKEQDATDDESFHIQVIRSRFLNSSWKGETEMYDSSGFYNNYYLGNDPTKWKSKLYSYSSLSMNDYYEGIDLLLDGREERLEYSFKVSRGADPNLIQMQYEGQTKLFLDDEGNLHIGNDFGEIMQSKPLAWTVSPETGKKKEVKVKFSLKNDAVQFEFPEGYDKNAELTIDPYLVFSSFTGSTMDNWGMTATPDSNGNTYAGGIVFTGAGSYPTVAGSFDVTYNGGTAYTYTTSNGANYNLQGFDVAISKFNANGTSLLFSTYLGGSANEAPHSMVVDGNDELYVFGVTSSGNFPVTAGAYDVTFNGGPNISSNELGYPQGSDIYIAHFNSAGSALVAATFIGGSGTDGINTGSLNYNYGDPFRGEIIVSGQSVYVSSTTQSTNFPIVGGSQSSLSGAQDAVIFKMNTNLSTLNWSTYFGGSGLETGNSLQLSSGNYLYVTGGTTSSNLPISNGVDLTYDGGVSDGYILKLSSLNGNFLAGTYVGYSEYDQCYFVQLDLNDDVYVFGQSETSFPISAGVYSNPNSGQFIRKYSGSLNSIIWTTMLGGGTGHPEISPTAFLVSNCGDIYFSGWGGQINTYYSNQATYSTTNGFPVTPNAYQSTTNGSNFYIGVLTQNAVSLQYATYMGSMTNSSNHVDGGTSRFDKSGRIYHAVCGACGANPYGFTTTPGVWSPTNQSNNCNLAAFKFELNTIEAAIADPNPVVCLPNPVDFVNNSINGNTYYWDFGDNTSSTAFNPTHVYPGPGTYYGYLVASDISGCYSPDTVDFIVTVGDFTGGVVLPTSPICPGDSYQMEAFGGASYNWTPGQALDDSTSATPFATITQTTDFTVVISDTCGIDTVYVTLEVFNPNSSISNDTSICIGESVNLLATGGVQYAWSPPTYLDNDSIADPVSTPTSTVTYQVAIVSAEGCDLQEDVTVEVFYNPPVPVIPDTVIFCKGSSVDLTVSGADSYYWSPSQDITPVTGPSVTISTQDSMYYYCDFTNACGTITDSVYAKTLIAQIEAFGDTTICPGQSTVLWANGGIQYQWSPATSLNNYLASMVVASPGQPTLYIVQGTDINGCVDYDSVFVDLYPAPFIQTSPDVYAFIGDEIQLSATSSTLGPMVWYPAEYLSCVVCNNPVANPDQDYTYYVSYTDINGCSASDTVHIYYDPIIYVPNTFTPDEGGINPVFKAVGGNINSFEMLIFDRWGELICTLNSIDEYWDGTYKGHICQDGTYTWKITLTDLRDKEYHYVGHVNLIR